MNLNHTWLLFISGLSGGLLCRFIAELNCHPRGTMQRQYLPGLGPPTSTLLLINVVLRVSIVNAYIHVSYMLHINIFSSKNELQYKASWKARRAWALGSDDSQKETQQEFKLAVWSA